MRPCQTLGYRRFTLHSYLVRLTGGIQKTEPEREGVLVEFTDYYRAQMVFRLSQSVAGAFLPQSSAV